MAALSLAEAGCQRMTALLPAAPVGCDPGRRATATRPLCQGARDASRGPSGEWPRNARRPGRDRVAETVASL